MKTYATRFALALCAVLGAGGWMNVMDLGGRRILSVRTRRDADFQRPRPLMMTQARNGVRLYAGREWVLLSAR